MVPLPFKQVLMQVTELQKLDSSFQVINEIKSFSIDTITDMSECKNNSLVFIKNKKFFQEFSQKNHEGKIFGLILEKKYHETLDSEELKKIENYVGFIAIVDDVNISMSKMSKTFYDKKFANENNMIDGRQMGTAKVHPSSFISQGAFIGDGVTIGPMAKIHPGAVIHAGSIVGEGTEIFPNTTIYHNVIIGKNVRIHAGCTIGSDGFGYNFHQGIHLKVWHMGGVIIGDNVEIGGNSCVDSGTFSPTIIGEGTKIDNLVQVGHNAKVGKHVILCADVALAGSCTLEDYVAMGGMSAVSNGVNVGMAAQIAAMSGVISNVEAKQSVGGFPARDMKEWMRGNAMLRKLALSKNKES